MSRLSRWFESLKAPPPPAPSYDADGLRVTGKNVPFRDNERFLAAYRRGMASGHRYGDIDMQWRVAVACWAATNAVRLPGDFVECGVNTGVVSIAVCSYVDFNATSKHFWLFDTFHGIPEDLATPEEGHVQQMNAQLYRDVYGVAQQNFAAFPRAHLVRGRVPDTLTTVPIGQVAYLHIDMNVAYPERKALEFFWPKLVPGALVLLDDYGWQGHEAQMHTADEFVRSQGVEILPVPTGQGLLIKPAAQPA